MSADGADGDGGTKQRFELYIKASAIDKETKGSCPMCQHWFMITCVLGENQEDIDFKVYTVQADCPPKNFGVEQGWSKKFPVIMVLEGRDKRGQDLSGTKYDTFEELEVFFESINRKCPALKRKNAPNVAAMAAVEDVYNAFNIALPSGKENKRLASALKKMNDFLEEDTDCKFLVDNVLSFADCYILPRLQHIRVAGKAYMSYDIPDKYTAIWKYLADAYQTEAFRSTMPSDQDIIFHYEKKVGHLLKDKKLRYRPTLQSFTYTLDVPEDIALLLESSATADANGDADQHPAPVERTDIGHQQQQHREGMTIPVSYQQQQLEEEEEEEEEVTVSVSHQVEEVAPPALSQQEEEEVSASHQQVEESQQQEEEVSFSQQQVHEVSSTPQEEETTFSQQEEEEVWVSQQQQQQEVEEDKVEVSVSQPEEAGVGQERVDGGGGGGGGAGEEDAEAVYENVDQRRASPVVCEASAEESAVEVVVTSEEGVVTRASPPPLPEDDSDVGGVTVAAAAADDDDREKNGTDGTSVAVDGEAVSPDSNGDKEVVTDAVDKDTVGDAGGVTITVTQDGDNGDGDVKREVGNGEVVKDSVSKGDVIHTNDGTAGAE